MTSNNKIRIKGLGNIVLIGDKIEPEKEYLVSIRVELGAISKDIKDKNDPIYTYICEYINTELVQEIGSSKKLKVVMGRTWSQKVKFALEQLAVKKGIDPEIFYEQEQKKRLAEIFNEIDE